MRKFQFKHLNEGSELVKVLIMFLKIAGVFLGLILVLFVINILQKGLGWDKRSIISILGKEAKEATVKDLRKLKKKELMQLFYAAQPVDLSSFKGEYRAETIPAGILFFAADFYTHKLFGPGRWGGKAFYPVDQTSGRGYNIFYRANKDGSETVLRVRKFDTCIDGSRLVPEGESLHLVYERYNSGLAHSMKDEVRKINDNLYLGMGHLAAGGGPINPAPFVLIGPPSGFVGLDE